MAHEHTHDHSHGHGHHHPSSNTNDGSIRKSLFIALAVTLTFCAIEFAGGIYSNSLALLADASHMLTDSASLVVALAIHWISRRPSSPRLSFGYQRAEILGALFSGLVLWLLSGALVLEAIRRIQSPQAIRGEILIAVATVGLIANIISLKTLHHDQSHNLNVRAAYLHIVSDLLGSIGAILSGIIIYVSGLTIFDPIITILFAALMVFNSWKLIREAVSVLMQFTPEHIDPEAVRIALASLSGVEEIHDLHIWTVRSGNHALSVHIVAEDADAVLNRANELLEAKFEIHHTTIQIERRESFKSDHCYDCASETPMVVK